MCKIIEKFSYETGKMEKYEIIDVMVDVKVKQDEFRSSHQYYKRLSDGELFEPFDNPDKNLEADYDTYRKKHNLLSPKQIKNIRKKYGLSIREFATLLNISYSNLSSIENGSIQAGYIDSLIRLSEDPYALRKLFLERKPNFSEKTMNNLADTLEELILTSYEEHKDIAKEVREHHLDIRNNLVRVVNVICYESRKEEGEYNWIKNSNSNKKKQALKIFPLS